MEKSLIVVKSDLEKLRLKYLKYVFERIIITGFFNV